MAISTFRQKIAFLKPGTETGLMLEDALVGTTETRTYALSPVRLELGIEPTGREEVVLPDGSLSYREIGEADIVVLGLGPTRRRITTTVVFIDHPDDPLADAFTILGAQDIEALGLEIDPENQCLVPM